MLEPYRLDFVLSVGERRFKQGQAWACPEFPGFDDFTFDDDQSRSGGQGQILSFVPILPIPREAIKEVFQRLDVQAMEYLGALGAHAFEILNRGFKVRHCAESRYLIKSTLLEIN